MQSILGLLRSKLGQSSGVKERFDRESIVIIYRGAVFIRKPTCSTVLCWLVAHAVRVKTKLATTQRTALLAQIERRCELIRVNLESRRITYGILYATSATKKSCQSYD